MPNFPHLELDQIGHYAMAKIKEAVHEPRLHPAARVFATLPAIIAVGADSRQYSTPATAGSEN